MEERLKIEKQQTFNLQKQVDELNARLGKVEKLLNYLKQINKTYREVKKVDILNFVDHLLFAKGDSPVISFQTNVSYRTAASYLTVIKEFYKYVEDMSTEKVYWLLR